MAIRLAATLLVAELLAALNRRDGYIMGATGQDPKKWDPGSWWFKQYTNAAQKAKALYWREHAERVWDCNGLAEGIYQEHTGKSINTYARLNYAEWCGVKGKGLIPAKYRVPGAAVFWGETASAIHHVGYLWKPVISGEPGGDWYLIEARGVMYGVVMTRLNSRKPNYWGLMDKYFDYSLDAETPEPALYLGARTLTNGSEGDDVKALQAGLIQLGYDLGRWGADGEYGDCTEMAIKAFQGDHGLEADGRFGPLTLAAYEAAMSALAAPVATPKKVRIEGGSCYVRSAPNTGGAILGGLRAGDEAPFAGVTDEASGWLLIVYKNQNAWVSGKYGRLVG